MRFLPILPLTCSLVAFILTFLTLFAGSPSGFIENGDMMTLNLSTFGLQLLNETQPTNGGLLGALEGLIQQIENGINQDLTSYRNGVANALGLKDFYSLHVLDYCEGNYSPTPYSNATVSASKNISYCSPRTGNFDFNFTAIIDKQLVPGVSLSLLKWPQEFQGLISKYQTTFRVMVAMYCITAGFVGLSLIAGVVAIFARGRIPALLSSSMNYIAFSASSIASSTATAVISNFVEEINDFGNSENIYASQGSKFLGMTWATTGILLVSAMVWMVECCLPRMRRDDQTNLSYRDEGTWSHMRGRFNRKDYEYSEKMRAMR